MKRILGIAAIAGLLTAAPAFAGVDVFVQFGTPVYTTPAPVYVAPVTYYGHGPRWHHRHDRFDRHFHRGHHGHHGYRDFHDRRWHREYRGRH